MPYVKLDTDSYTTTENESVLDCLLRHQQDIPYACRSGVCQSCLVRAVDCAPTAKATTGLKSTLQASGYALACQWIPEGDIEIRLPGATEQAVAAIITRMDKLNTSIIRLILTPADSDTMFESRPGQYLNLINPTGVTRSYSIANDYSLDGHLELHIANMPQGELTHWLFNEAKPGDRLHLRGAAGDCFYVNPDQQPFPLLLVGTGTGLAPLYGIAHDALRQAHQGKISLFHGGSLPERLYYVDELTRLASLNPDFYYQALVLSGTGTDSHIQQGDIEQAAINSIDPHTISQLRVYICGAPEFVQGLRKKIFLKGVRSTHIYCDAFVTRKAAQN
jgi:NAD(P)H-flavin reductase/ferredoxin